MTSESPEFRVRYRLRGDAHDRTMTEGPWYDQRSAIAHRDAFFKRCLDVVSAWVERDDVPVGMRLERLV